ncbi:MULTISPECIES: biotin/lipoyl-binding protein [unclassified Bradyrhizobium]|uniref:biotin/lipoyl-binding protein n=1 Tax=unclassified Bradyrhizobium TaxID=2631580 RepID=UPI0033935D75
MHKARLGAMVAIPLALVASVIYSARCSGSTPPVVGVVRTTEVTMEPEVTGQLQSIAVEEGAHLREGDILARLSAVEFGTV